MWASKVAGAGETARASRRAPAKVNLALHVTGRREDGFHELSSLAVFAELGDVLHVAPSDTLSLRVEGPMAEGVPDDESNLVLQAAFLLARAREVATGAALSLDKRLPRGGGIGGGSADAAAALALLSDHWGVAPVGVAEALTLGADVPVCMAGPAPQVMSGKGETLRPAGPLPAMWIVLANPGVVVPTGAVFARLDGRFGAALPPVHSGAGFAAFIAWLADQRNDLEAPAQEIAPAIAALRDEMAGQAGCALARMSGSGSTVFGLFADETPAQEAARALQARGHWAAAARVLA